MTKFTSGNSGFYWRMMPSRNSAIWDGMITNMKTLSYRGAGTRGHHSIFSFDPSSINSKNIQWLMALDKTGTSRETKRALEEVGSYIAHEVNARIFAEEGKTSTGSWDALENSTIEWRIRHKPPYADSPILQASGALFRKATSDDAINEIKLGRNPRVIMGGANWPSGGDDNLMEKYFTHMGGSWTGWQGSYIPARPFMPESPEDFTSQEEEHIKNIFKEHIYELYERI
jgi:phage gpG-like protein